jgi:hypothetical protein
LLSNSTTAVALVSANPKLLAGAFTQLCTSAVTSTATNAPASFTGAVCTAAEVPGRLWKVTPSSVHALVSGCTFTVPAVVTWLAYSTSTAREICVDVVPGGSRLRSNRISPV